MGWAVIERRGGNLGALGYGLIETAPSELSQRLRQIGAKIEGLIEEFRPDRLAVERQIFGANRTTALDVAKATGVALYVAAAHEIQVTEYLPNEIKLCICGNGRADKKQVEYMVMRLAKLATRPRPDDVADAIAIALTDALRLRPSGEMTLPGNAK